MPKACLNNIENLVIQRANLTLNKIISIFNPKKFMIIPKNHLTYAMKHIKTFCKAKLNHSCFQETDLREKT